MPRYRIPTTELEQVVRLHRQRLPIPAIAGRLDLTEDAVRRRVVSARKRLGYTGNNRGRVKSEGPRRLLPGHVVNDPLREAFLASGVSASKLAEGLGMTAGKGKPDTSAVKRSLGLMPESGGTAMRRTMREEKALRFAEMLGLDPVEIGL